jgi:hypothetical protein
MSDTPELKTPEQILNRWLKRARESQLAHHLMSETLERDHKLLGIIVIAITSIAGATAIFSELKGDTKLVLGLFTLSATILTTLQTFLKLEERANRHRVAAAGYGEARRKLEFANALPADQAEARLKEVEISLNKLAQESPNVSKSVLDKAIKRNSNNE